MPPDNTKLIIGPEGVSQALQEPAEPKIFDDNLKLICLLLLADVLASLAPFPLSLIDEGFLFMVWIYIFTVPLAVALIVTIPVVFVLNILKRRKYSSSRSSEKNSNGQTSQPV